MCSLEEKLQEEGEILSFYKGYVDENFAIMPKTAEAYAFLEALNSNHPALTSPWNWLTTNYNSLTLTSSKMEPNWKPASKKSQLIPSFFILTIMWTNAIKKAY